MSALDALDNLEHVPLEHGSVAAVADGELPEGLLIANQFDHRGLRKLLPHKFVLYSH